MQNFKKAIGIIAGIICVQYSLKAQDTVQCNCYQRPDYHAPIGVMIDHGNKKGEWMVSYRLMDMNMSGSRMGTEHISPDQVYKQYVMRATAMNMQMHMLMAMYGISNKITVMAMANYVYNSMNMGMTIYGMGSMMNMTNMSMMNTTSTMQSSSYSYGLGDTKVYALYTIVDKQNHQVLISGGINIPTGSVTIKNSPSMTEMGSCSIASYNMQTGTGTFGILPGITYTGQNSSFSWGVQGLADVELGTNSQSYRVGNQFTTNLWLSRKWAKWISNSIRINSNATGLINGFSSTLYPYGIAYDPTANTANTGGFISSVLAGVSILPGGFFRGHQLSVEAGLPLYNYVNGIQMNTKFLLNAGWQYNF